MSPASRIVANALLTAAAFADQPFTERSSERGLRAFRSRSLSSASTSICASAIPGVSSMWIAGDVMRSSPRAPASRAFSGKPTTTERHAGSSWCCKLAGHRTVCIAFRTFSQVRASCFTLKASAECRLSSGRSTRSKHSASTQPMCLQPIGAHSETAWQLGYRRRSTPSSDIPRGSLSGRCRESRCVRSCRVAAARDHWAGVIGMGLVRATDAAPDLQRIRQCSCRLVSHRPRRGIARR